MELQPNRIRVVRELPPNALAYLKYISALLLFGSNGIVAKHICLPSWEIVFWRTLIGSLFLTAVFFAAHRKIAFAQQKRDCLFISLSGAAMGTSWLFLYEAYSQIGVGAASLLYYCGPVIVMALSPLMFQERLTRTRAAGFAAVLAGITLVNESFGETLNVFGLFCGLMSAVMYALMVLLNRKSESIKGLENAALQLMISFLTVALFTGLKTGFQMSLPEGSLAWIGVLGLVNTGTGCYLYFSSIGDLSVQTVATLGYTEPLSAVVLAALVLGENMPLSRIAGAALIIGGSIFCESQKN